MAPRFRIIRRQKSIKGGRQYVGAGVIKEIETAIQKEMRQYGVSRSFVIAVALSDVFNIDEQERYHGQSKAKGG